MEMVRVELLGVQHPLCFSTAAFLEICDAYGDIDGMVEALDSKALRDRAEATVKVLGILLKAGRAYAKATGEDIPEPIRANLADIVPINSAAVRAALIEAIVAGNTRHVQSKNVEATAEN